MSRVLRNGTMAPRSIAGRIKAVVERHKTPLALGVAAGLRETDRIKLSAKQKVAWQHAQPDYVQYSDFLSHALRRQQWQRLHVVLHRMLVDSVRWGKPAYVEPCLLDKCVDDLLSALVDGGHGSTIGIRDQTLIDSADCLTEIAWRTAHDTKKLYPKWELVAAIAGDRNSDGSSAYIRAMRNLERAVCAGECVSVRQTLTAALESSQLSARLLSGLFDICLVANDVRSGDLLTNDLVAAFYLAVQRRSRPQSADLNDMAAKIEGRLANDHGTIISDISKCDETCEGSATAAKAAVSLAHLHLSQANSAKALEVNSHFRKLSALSRWPMDALARSVEILVTADRKNEACDILLYAVNNNHKGFMQIIRDSALLSDNVPVLRALVEDELGIRLHDHKRQAVDRSIDTSENRKSKQNSPPPMTAFFAPGAHLYLKDHDSVKNIFKGYYANIGRVLQTTADKEAVVRIAACLISEASDWSFRLQSPDPLIWLAQAIASNIKALGSKDMSCVLLEYTRTLCNFKMLRHVATGNVIDETSHAGYTNTLNGYTRIREVVLREYLCHGIEPPPEALATFAQHMRMSGEHRNAQELAAAILPQMLPQLTASRNPGNLAVRSYYEWMLCLCGMHSQKRLIQLFEYLMGHHGVDNFHFKTRLVELTVCSFLRHEHFHGMGFYQLERAFVRFVDRPWFPAGYLSSVRPRFWELYMFLRRQRYIPLLKIRPYQFRTTSKGLYKMEITAIPSEAKMKAQNVDFTLNPIVKEDIDTAIGIFMGSRPWKQRGLERYSVASIIDKYSKLVTSQTRS